MDSMLEGEDYKSMSTQSERAAHTMSQKSRAFVIFISSVAAIGALLYGYDTAFISGAIGFMQSHFGFGAAMEGFVVSSILIGGALGVLFSGSLSDKIGRRKVLAISGLIFGVATIICAIANSLSIIIASRMFGGLGIGAASVLSVAYISEVAPPSIRGRLATLYQFAVAVGIIGAYFVNLAVVSFGTQKWEVSTGWRYMLIAGAIPAFLYFVFLLFVPESPRWLQMSGRETEAFQVLERINGTEIARQELNDIKKSTEQHTRSLSEVLKPGVKRALVVGIVLAVLQQFVGINAIIYYAPQVFQAAGAHGNTAFEVTVLIGVAGFLGILCSMWLIDKVGRKPLLLFGATVMALALIGVGIAFNAHASAYLTIGLIFLFLFGFNISVGPIVWVLLSEIFPNLTRGLAMSIATFFMWVANWVVSQSFPVLLNKVGLSECFWIYAVFCIVTFVFVLRSVVETKNKSLEEIEKLWV